MTSMDADQLEPEEMPPIADRLIEHTTEPTGEKRRDPTNGNMRKDPNLTGSLQRTLADHGSFTRYLAKLAKSMFTHQEPYLDAEENVPFDPGILGEPPGDISATLGNFPLLMAAHVNLIRRLLMAFQGPTEADQDLLHSKGNLPYLPELKGNLTEVTSGITKEMTANFQDPDPTLNRPRPTFRSPTRSYYGVTLENSPLTATYHYLPPLPPIPYFTSPRSTRQPPSMFTSRHYFMPSLFHQRLAYSSTIYFPYPSHHHHFITSLTTAIRSWRQHFPCFISSPSITNHLTSKNLSSSSKLHGSLLQ